MEWSDFITKFCEAFNPIWEGKRLTGEEECLEKFRGLIEEREGEVSLDRIAELCPFLGEGEHALDVILDLCATK